MKIAITTGGTGGHIFPALSLMEHIINKDSNNELIYIGNQNRLEATLIPEKGYKFYGLNTYAFSKDIIHDFKNVNYMRIAYKEAKKILREEKIEGVVAFGGYVTFPVILAAHKLNIPVFMHEQNVIPGKVNKVLKALADRIFISFKESTKYLKGDKVIYSGNPTSSRAKLIKAHNKTKIGFNKDKKLIIIVMGSLGSSTVNDKMLSFLKTFKDFDKEVLFITGKSYYETMDKDIDLGNSIQIVEFYNDLPALMKSADLIITRAGASTLSEILTTKIPSIIIPSPYVANNHQYYNALDLKNSNLCEMIEEKNLNNDTLRKAIDEVMFNSNKIIKENLENVELPESCDIMYNEIEKIIKNK